jgi:hypothetical protein
MWLWLLRCRVRFVLAWWVSACPGRFPGVLPLVYPVCRGSCGWCWWRVLVLAV